MVYTPHCTVQPPPVWTPTVSVPLLCDRDPGYDLLQEIKRFDNGANRHIESEWDAA